MILFFVVFLTATFFFVPPQLNEGDERAVSWLVLAKVATSSETQSSKPLLFSFSDHLLQLPLGKLINKLQNRLHADRIGEALAGPEVLLYHQHAEVLLL